MESTTEWLIRARTFEDGQMTAELVIELPKAEPKEIVDEMVRFRNEQKGDYIIQAIRVSDGMAMVTWSNRGVVLQKAK